MKRPQESQDEDPIPRKKPSDDDNLMSPGRLLASPAKKSDIDKLNSLRNWKPQAAVSVGAPSPLRAAGTASAEDAKGSPTSRGAQLLKLAQKREESSSRFSVSAMQHTAESPSKNALLDPRRSLFTAPESPMKPVQSPKRTCGPVAASPSRAAAVAAPPPLPRFAEELYEEFGIIDTLLGLAQQRGEACWWEDVCRGAGAMRGENAMRTLVLELVETVLPGIWKWSWERRDDRQQLQLRLVNGTVATEAGLEARRISFRNALEALCKSQHDEFLSVNFPGESHPRTWHPRFVPKIDPTVLPPRPALQSGLPLLASSAARLGVPEAKISKETADQIASATVPDALSHLPKHVVVEARLREELALANAVSDSTKMLSGLPALCESLRSFCLVNKRYIWPFVVLCTKLVPANTVHRPGVKEELRAQLEEIGSITEGYVAVFENTHADGGTFVKVEKKGFAEAMAKLSAAAATKPL